MKQLEKIRVGLLLLVVGLLLAFSASAQEEIIRESQASGDYLFINIKIKNNIGTTDVLVTELNHSGEDTVLVHEFTSRFVTIKLSLNQDYEITYFNNGKEKHMYVFSDNYDITDYWVYLDLDWKSDTDICSVVYEDNLEEFEIIIPMAGKSKDK